jgi:hypothetical protein
MANGSEVVSAPAQARVEYVAEGAPSRLKPSTVRLMASPRKSAAQMVSGKPTHLSGKMADLSEVAEGLS